MFSKGLRRTPQTTEEKRVRDVTAYCAVETAAQAKEHKLDKPRTKDRASLLDNSP